MTDLHKALQITHVQAIPLHAPLHLEAAGVTRETSLSCVIVRVETAGGLVGCGFTGITEEEVVAAAINEVAAHHLVGLSALESEKAWYQMSWLLAPRGQSGYASHAIAALDVALWDLKAQALGVPLWQLLGGARPRVPVYATFGFGFLDREQLAQAARDAVARGFTRLKMTVGMNAAERRGNTCPLADVIREDEVRVRAVRDAIGPSMELCIDANCSLDPLHARILADRLGDCGISFFEEPLFHNDVRALAELRTRAPMPLAAGQNEGQASRFADFFTASALDIAQPNVVISGGYTQCLRIAGMAQAFNVTLANGGAWPFHNMHLHAGIAQGGFVEYHSVAMGLCELLFRDLPVPEGGWLDLPVRSGLGFEPDWGAIGELAKRPLSRGAGKA